MKQLTLAALLVTVTTLGGCGERSSAFEAHEDSKPEPQHSAPIQLTCPSKGQVETGGGYLARLPDGFDTRDEAVEAWLQTAEGVEWVSGNEDYVIAANGRWAWTLRPDGTAAAKVHFLRHDGYTVHGYQACSR